MKKEVYKTVMFIYPVTYCSACKNGSRCVSDWLLCLCGMGWLLPPEQLAPHAILSQLSLTYILLCPYVLLASDW